VNILAVTLESPRELRGLEILAKEDQIHRIDADTYRDQLKKRGLT